LHCIAGRVFLCFLDTSFFLDTPSAKECAKLLHCWPSVPLLPRYILLRRYLVGKGMYQIIALLAECSFASSIHPSSSILGRQRNVPNYYIAGRVFLCFLDTSFFVDTWSAKECIEASGINPQFSIKFKF